VVPENGQPALELQQVHMRPPFIQTACAAVVGSFSETLFHFYTRKNINETAETFVTTKRLLHFKNDDLKAVL
jgi:hypothetical protein